MLSEEDKPRHQEVIDMMVWAKIPDEKRYLELNVKVLKHMVLVEIPPRDILALGTMENVQKIFVKKLS